MTRNLEALLTLSRYAVPFIREVPTPLNNCLGMALLFGVHANKFQFSVFPDCTQCFAGTKRQRQTRTFGAASACQKSLAEFAARRRQRDSDHFLSGRTPGWSLLPLRGNSPPVPDRKYNSGCKSSAAALCRAQPPKAALGAELCDLYARAYKSCARQTAILLPKKGKALFWQSQAAPNEDVWRCLMRYCPESCCF